MEEEMKQRLEELRQIYVKATPRQRFQVALQRLEYKDSGPNQLIQHVSAVEGFARSVALDFERKAGTPVEQAYTQLRNVGPVALIRDHIAPKIRVAPDVLFGSEDWELFDVAVQFRHLLVHEAIFLGQHYSNQLIPVCKRVLAKLGEIAGVNAG